MRLRRAFLSAAVVSLAAYQAFTSSACVKSDVPEPLQIVNPVMPGDFPDPSVIRVGEDYWAAATSSEWAPQYPLLHSKDLVHWEVVGSIFTTPPSWTTANYWGPEIATDNGHFFVYYTAHKKDGPLCVGVATADQPQGPYTDHGPLVCQSDGSIDGSIVRDENNKLYLVWKQDGNSHDFPTPIWAQQLSEDGTLLVGEKQQLIVNDTPWEGQVVEAPYITKHDGYFYLFYAGGFCCGSGCNYGTGVARSRKLLSGWEKNPLNPIVHANTDWKCPGHGTVVNDPYGRSYFLYHAMSTKDSIYVGRQGVLSEIQWGADGWPVINDRKGISGTATTSPPAFTDDFNGSALAPGWQWPVGAEQTVTVANGMLTLAPTGTGATGLAAAAVGRSAFVGNYTATAVVDVSSLTSGTIVGISAFGDPDHAIGAGLRAGRLELWRKDGTTQQTLTTVDAPSASSGKLQLRLTAKDGHLFRFSASGDGTTFVDVGAEVDGAYLPPWDRGLRVVLAVGGGAGTSARFDSLTIQPN